MGTNYNMLKKIRNKIYYNLKPIMPRRIQIALRRMLVQQKRKLTQDVWPIDKKSLKIPDNWTGWPEQKRFAVILTHDVEGAKGVQNCLALSELEKRLGFRSSFNFVIEDYHTSPKIRHNLVSDGFEVGIHGLTHNQKFLQTEKDFLKQCPRINQCLKDWNVIGYRTPSMLGNLSWINRLNIEYDASTFDTDPFEPKPDGVQTIFPFWVDANESGKGFVELPYTLPQDFTLYIIMQEKRIDIWRQKLDWIAKHGGMALLITHPDYMNFTGKDLCIDEYPVRLYADFLEYIKTKYEGQYWHVLPKEIAQFWLKRRV